MSASSPVVDVHVHVSETKALGAWSKEAYEIWEYGDWGVAFSTAAGDLDDLRSSMRAGGIDHAVVVNAFSVGEWLERSRLGLELPERASRSLGEHLVAFNAWLVDAVTDVPEVTPFVAADPWALPFDELAAHLEDMRRAGALGVKIHPVAQAFVLSEPRMLRVLGVCADLGLTVLSHSGPDRDGAGYAEPAAFADVARAVPGLRLVVAHLGGASWRGVPDLAEAFPAIAFDLSEIVEWTGAPSAPSADELVGLIRRIGVDRVMFGTDFPWYEPGETVKRVRTLPGLSDGEAEAILGANAVRILSLDV